MPTRCSTPGASARHAVQIRPDHGTCARAIGRPASRLEPPTRLRTGKARGRGRLARVWNGCRAARPSPQAFYVERVPVDHSPDCECIGRAGIPASHGNACAFGHIRAVDAAAGPSDEGCPPRKLHGRPHPCSVLRSVARGGVGRMGHVGLSITSEGRSRASGRARARGILDRDQDAIEKAPDRALRLNLCTTGSRQEEPQPR
jgi:hypothetical protein